jgi:valyl-tRNA synthetase
LVLAKAKPKPNKDLNQDVDALDTWFSSWLWPMSVLVE